MKKVVWVGLIIGLLFSFTLTDATSKTIVIKAVTAFPKNHQNNDPVPIFVNKVNERAKGRLRIDWLGGPEVIKSFDQALALKAGTIDMLLYYPFGYMQAVMPEAWTKGLSELTAWEERKSGAFELWDEIFAKRVNAKYIGQFHSIMPFALWTNKKIEKVADLKGMKIRVMPLYIPFLKALGASPVTLPPPEIYTSLERGVVDGFMWIKQGITSFGLQEVVKYQLDHYVFQAEPATIMNLNKWKQIPKDLQDLISEIMQDMEFIATMRFIMLEEAEAKIKKAAGMIYLTLPPEEAAKWRNTAYDETWKYVMKNAPEYGQKLKEVSTKDALPKGAFPWK
ncbi:TRAP transporter substrate-binding protein DctP [bacterium]|nr:TRAP transporter substrate-binding protein DctP [bacterium]